MKKETICGLLALSIIGGISYQLFHTGGKFNPHILTITEDDLVGVATDNWRYCTFKPKVPFDVRRGDYVSLFLPGNKESKFKNKKATTVRHVFVMCKKDSIDASQVIAPLDEGKAIKMCPDDGSDLECEAEDVQDAAPYLNKLLLKKLG